MDEFAALRRHVGPGGRRTLQGLEVGVDTGDIVHLGGDVGFQVLGDGMRLGERHRSRELGVERDVEAIGTAGDEDVVYLMHRRVPGGHRQDLLGDDLLVRKWLDMDDDVGPRLDRADRLLHFFREGMCPLQGNGA